MSEETDTSRKITAFAIDTSEKLRDAKLYDMAQVRSILQAGLKLYFDISQLEYRQRKYQFREKQNAERLKYWVDIVKSLDPHGFKRKKTLLDDHLNSIGLLNNPEFTENKYGIK